MKREAGYPNREAVRAKISLGKRLQLYSNVQTMRVIKASFLEAVLPEFRGGRRAVLEVTLFRESKSTFLYRFYEGGELWHPAIPEELAKPGDILYVSFKVLTPEVFLSRIPPIELIKGVIPLKWLAQRSQLTGFILSGNSIYCTLRQSHGLVG